MKTTNNFSKFKNIALLMFAALSIAACGKKGSNNNNNTGYYPGNGYPYQCTTCAAGSIPLLNSVQFQHGSSANHMDGNVTIFGTNNGTADMNDPKAIVAYRGEVTLVGQLRISNSAYFCGAPVGIYNLTPVAPAMSQLGVISNVRLVAQGPAQITLESVGSTQVYNTNTATGTYRDSQTNRIGFNLHMTVNGQPCGTVSTW